MYLSNQEWYGRKLQTGHKFQQDIMKLVKCNCTKSNRRTGKSIWKKAKLYCTTFFGFRWIMMLFAKIRTLMTSALWIQALLRTRLMFQSSFVHYAETRFLISSANRKAFFLAMETLGWSKYSEILDITEISIKYFVFAPLPPKSTVPLGVHIEIRTTL